MAASIDGVFEKTLQDNILNSKIFVVGAGGIGCEILKNLVMSGFRNIEIIDLDTIDLSNLNRQFLFHREHVGKPKALVARESALKFNPDVKIQAYHDSIFNTNYGVNFYKKFNIVLNALDNRAARNHVNRMCLNAGVPLLESGTAGYNGQVELIYKGMTQCYECTPKPAQKTFPGCTIRNTPSEPIHCIVWAKHLFNQLFGETVEDEDISPDKADPEALNENDTENATENSEKTSDKGNIVRINTRQWAKDINYDPAELFNKFFYDDINYLLSMSNLWKTRKAPTPSKWECNVLDTSKVDNLDFVRQYHKVWSMPECTTVFANCLKSLSEKFVVLDDSESLVWDKDDQPAMDFVAACANIRAYIFDIPRKNRFEVKSMAGNIIPAIATTNAITAGVVVMHAFKALEGQLEKCRSVYMRLRPNPRQQLLVPEKNLTPPNPNCHVCGAEPAIRLRVDTTRVHIKEFRDEILIKTLNMVNPDVIVDSKGVVLISSEEGETECNEQKLLKDMDIVDGVILQCDDFFQNYTLAIIIEHFEAERDEPLFEVVAGDNPLKPKEEKPAVPESNGKGGSKDEDDFEDGPSTSKKRRLDVSDDDDDLCIIEEDDEESCASAKLQEMDIQQKSSKQAPTIIESESSSSNSSSTSSSSTAAPRVALKRKSSVVEIEDDEITEITDSTDDEETEDNTDDDGDDDDDDDDGPTQSKRSRYTESTYEDGGTISD